MTAYPLSASGLQKLKELFVSEKTSIKIEDVIIYDNGKEYTRTGWLQLSVVFHNELNHVKYGGYTEREAINLFKQHLIDKYGL